MGRQHRNESLSGWGRAAIAAGLVLASAIDSRAGEDWVTDVDEGRRYAEAEGKDLLINFTGTEWCGPCETLERDVLDQPEFLDAADRAFILVELDYPASDEDLPGDVRDDFIEWRDRYGIRAFPTVILADDAGLPYAITGNLGIGPEAFVRHLDTLRSIREVRDAAFAKASNSRGAERAGHLDEGLSTLRSGFGGPVAEDRDGVLLRFYRPRVEEVLAIARAQGLNELVDKYELVFTADREHRSTAAIEDRLDAIRNSDGLDAAIGAADRAIEEADSVALRNRLRVIRLVYLEWSDRNEEALAFAEGLSGDASFSDEERRWFRDRAAFNLKNLGRIDEAAAVFDGLIAEALADGRTTADPDRRTMAGYHDTKAAYLAGAGRFNEALETREAARQYTDLGTSDWINNECFRAELLIKLGRVDDAVAVLDAAAECGTLDDLDRAGLLAESALNMSKAGRREEAIARANRAEQFLSKFEPEHADLPFVEIIREKIETAQREGP